MSDADRSFWQSTLGCASVNAQSPTRLMIGDSHSKAHVKVVLTEIAIGLDLLELCRRSADPKSILDTGIRASGQELPLGRASHEHGDRFGTNKSHAVLAYPSSQVKGSSANEVC